MASNREHLAQLERQLEDIKKQRHKAESIELSSAHINLELAQNKLQLAQTKLQLTQCQTKMKELTHQLQLKQKTIEMIQKAYDQSESNVRALITQLIATTNSQSNRSAIAPVLSLKPTLGSQSHHDQCLQQLNDMSSLLMDSSRPEYGDIETPQQQASSPIESHNSSQSSKLLSPNGEQLSWKLFDRVVKENQLLKKQLETKNWKSSTHFQQTIHPHSHKGIYLQAERNPSQTNHPTIDLKKSNQSSALKPVKKGKKTAV